MFDQCVNERRVVRETSLEAYKMALEDLPDLQRKIHSMLYWHGPKTADEIATDLRVTLLTVRPAVTKMNQCGMISDTGDRRASRCNRPAIVWQYVPPKDWKINDDRWTAAAKIEWLRAEVLRLRALCRDHGIDYTMPSSEH